MDFTKAQKAAIDERGSSLIISAGAGSGKTAVLTERILSRICDENDDCNIDDFLIVTFTNAAAKELSDRIRKKLSDRALENPDSKKILKNIALLPLAKIATINSFCYEIVRENFQKLGLSAAVRIADEAEMELIRTKLMNETVSEYFETNGDDKIFLAAYEIFSTSKSDKSFIDTLLDFDLKLRNLPDIEGFMDRVVKEYIQVYKSQEFYDTDFGKRLRQSTISDAQAVEAKMQELIDVSQNYKDLAEKYVPALECERDFARLIIKECSKGYDDVKQAVEGVSKVALKPVRNPENPAVKELVRLSKAQICDAFRNKLSEKYCCSHEQLRLSAMDTEKIISKLYELVVIFSSKLNERKNELSILEFSDCERLALSLLVESTEPFKVTDTAYKLRQKFKEIYIDEYQDVNPLQDMIFRAIARVDDRDDECDRFMVGDIKQSIYSFRGANSDIFMSYRDTFSDIGQHSSKKRIFMQDNFRCCESVIELTNLLFSKLMKEYFTDGDRLMFSRNENVKINSKVNFLAFSFDKDAALSYSSTELEAAMICKKILELVKSPDHRGSNGEMYKFSDIGILARSKQALRIYEKVLSEAGIPVHSDVGESFYQKPEIMLCICMLNAIDNPERDIYLAGFMRSFAGGFSDDELVLIKMNDKKSSLYHAVQRYGNLGNELSAKCNAFIEMLHNYRTYARGKCADKLIRKIYREFDLMGGLCRDKQPSERKNVNKNLTKLYDMARDFSKTSFRGVGAFIDYLSGSMQKDDVKSERETVGECVSLMTIHASKGLEFPICFVSNLSSRYNKSDTSSALVYSEKGGVASLLCDADGLVSSNSSSGLVSINTPYRKFVNEKIENTLYQEEVRILYVAMTRAKDRLFLTGSFPKKIENAMSDAYVSHFSDTMQHSSYFSLLLSSLADDRALMPFYAAAKLDFKPRKNEAEKYLECFYYTCDEAVQMLAEQCEQSKMKDCGKDTDNIDASLMSSMKEHAEYSLDKRRFQAKITVSRLKTGLLDEEDLIYTGIQDKEVKQLVPAFVSGVKGHTGADRGTAMHMFMQFADYEKCEKYGCYNEAVRLQELDFIDKSRLEMLDIRRLDGFFKTKLYSDISKSIQVYREQRFNLEVDAFDIKLPGQMLVQGVIDLFYENDDGTYTVVDFKTDRVSGENAEQILIDRHKEQLAYYRMAAEQITGRKVSRVVIYSFALTKEIDLL